MKNILKKCLEELSKESPKLDYVRGMLEVLIEQDVKPEVPPISFTPVQQKPINPHVNPHGLPDNPGMDLLSGKKIING